MQRRTAPIALIALLLALPLTGCRRDPAPVESATIAAPKSAPAAVAPPALATAPEVYPPTTCDEISALLRQPAAPVGASVDLAPLRDLLTGAAPLKPEDADRLKEAGPAAAPIADLIAARIISAPAEEAAHLLDALSVISPTLAGDTAARLIDTGAAEPSRLKVSVAASTLVSLGQPGMAAFLARIDDETRIPPPVRVSRMERMASYPVAAIELLFGKQGRCTAAPASPGCASLARQLLLARPDLLPALPSDPPAIRIIRAEASLLRGEPTSEAWLGLIADSTLPLDLRYDSFETLNQVVSATVALPAALALFRESLPLKAERGVALWLIARSGALRAPALLEQLAAPPSESEPHLVARSLIRMAAGDMRLVSEHHEVLRAYSLSERGDLAALAQLALLRVGKFAALTHPAFEARVADWTALVAAKDAEAMMAVRAGALRKENGVMLEDAAILWAAGREAALADRLELAADPEARRDAFRLAARLGPAGEPFITRYLDGAPDAEAAEPLVALTSQLDPTRLGPWIDAALASPRFETSGLRLAALSGYRPRQEVLLPLLLQERDGRKPGVLRQVDATRYAQLLLLRQSGLNRDRLAASRRELTPSDAGFSALGLVLFAASSDCFPLTAKP